MLYRVSVPHESRAPKHTTGYEIRRYIARRPALGDASSGDAACSTAEPDFAVRDRSCAFLTERMRTLVRENPARRDDEILDQVFLDCADRRDASREEIVKAGRSLADANKAVEALERALRPSLKDDIAKMKAQLPPR